jgi:hypothetical protein
VASARRDLQRSTTLGWNAPFAPACFFADEVFASGCSMPPRPTTRAGSRCSPSARS